MVFLHAADVVGEGDDLAFFGHGSFEADELGDAFTVGGVGGDAFFEEAGEFAVVFAPFFGVVLGFLVEVLQEAFGDDVAEFADEGGVLHGLAGDVEGEVFAVDDTADEAHPVGEELGGLGVDEYFFAVEGDAGFGLAHAHEFHVLMGEEEEGVDDEGGVCLEVEAVAGGVPGAGSELVEVVVLFVGDGVFGFEPDGVDGVDALAIEVDGEADEVGVALEDLADAVGFGEFGGVFFEVKDDGTAAFLLGGGGVDGVAGGAVAGPGEVLVVGAPGVGGDGDFVGDHEGGVEADAELADDFGFVAFAGVFEGGGEGFGAGVGDGAEVFDELVTGHAEAVIGDGEGAFFLVGGEGDFEGEIGLEDVVFGELGVAEFFEGVRGVGDELADEDFPVGVEGVDDDVEELFDFGLEFVFGGHGFRAEWTVI